MLERRTDQDGRSQRKGAYSGAALFVYRDTLPSFGRGYGRNITLALLEFEECNRLLPSDVVPEDQNQSMNRFFRTRRFLSVTTHLGVLGLLLLLPGCKSLNPLCGSARPSPVLDSISPNTMAFSTLPSSFTLSLTGSEFVSSSVVVFNGVTLPTTVVSSSVITVTITSSMISGPGSFGVQVQTPAGTSGDLGCSSGGNSSILMLTVT
jgi:hypothetical protein